MTHRTTRRRLALGFARTAAGVCAVALTLSITGLSPSGVPSASAAPTAGSLQVITPMDGTAGAGQPLDGGGSATPFSFLLPTDAACTGDSANDGYRVQSYVVPASVDPSTLTFDAAGPTPAAIGAGLRQPLYTVTASPYTDAQTANATTAGGPGPVINIPGFSFGVYEPGNVPAGTYNAGIACTLGPVSSTQLDRFWNVRLEVVADTVDEPAGLTWSVVAGDPTPTTTTTSSTTSTTAADGSTTTTSTSPTTLAASSPGGGTEVLATGGEPTATPFGSSLTSLPATGASLLSPVTWGVLLLITGRMAVLLGRPPRVLPARP